MAPVKAMKLKLRYEIDRARLPFPQDGGSDPRMELPVSDSDCKLMFCHVLGSTPDARQV